MVTKILCDKCKSDITKEERFSSEIYDVDAEKYIIELDLCKKCMLKFKDFFQDKK